MSNFSNNNKPIDLIPGLPFELALECLLRVPITFYSNLKLVSNGWKSIISNPSFYSERQRLSLSEHLIFFIQPVSVSPTFQEQSSSTIKNNPLLQVVDPPLYDLNVYNLGRLEWRRSTFHMLPLFSQCVAVMGKVIVLGGWDPVSLEPVNRVLVIDLVTGLWRQGSPMRTARSFFAVFGVVSGFVYVSGGHDGQKNALRSAECYDVKADRWDDLPDMLEERDECHGFSFDGSRIWVISGYGTESQGRFRSDCEVFDPETRAWSTIGGVWPYNNTCPKSTIVIANKKHKRWINMVNKNLNEFDWVELRWKGMNSGQIPDLINGSSSISLIDISEECSCDERILVMGNGEKGCGGEGAFILERGNGNGGEVMKWNHVYAPTKFLGVPYSTSHLLI